MGNKIDRRYVMDLVQSGFAKLGGKYKMLADILSQSIKNALQ